jgi:hypothetical protein
VEKGSGVVGSVEPGLTKAAAAITGIGPTAGRFIGDVEVTGNIHFGGGADCAEYFDAQTHEPAEPGTVLVLGDDGALKASQKAYDRRVAGIVSGAGSFRPAIILDHQVTARTRTLIALLGKTYCKVDAEHGRIEVGDLLTTSPTPGYAMKASDREQAFGAVIGKALQRLEEGQGLIPVLIALQ